ncbi:serine hydrolase [Nocardia colli]|uniref:Serine hydrolase n=1 Tax=Nocardia colli TaxID=2545717 RepID=A0A5N0DNC0_9NOCA|nr:serine hydrolase [Nocardia colli]KAA8877191.1 serine hydrolase [Nocardia colli]
MFRKLATLVAAALPVLASGSNHAAAEEMCASIPAASVTSVDGWLGRIHDDRDNIAIAVDDGTGNTVERRVDDQQPVASAVKVVPLAAYARAVAAGTLDPQQRVPVTEWERWYLPGADGGAHENARTRLPGDTVTLDEMVSAMIRESDNAVPDYLRDRLGDGALIAAAEAGGWHDYQPPSVLGSMLRLLDPNVTDDWAAARHYAEDPGYRTAIQTGSAPSYGVQASWADTTWTASARQLTNIHRSIATGSFGPGADIARRHLEWQSPPEASDGIGFKGGSLPGVLADAIYVRHADGRVATAVLLNRHMPEPAWRDAMESFSQQKLLLQAMTDPEMMRRLACVV